MKTCPTDSYPSSPTPRGVKQDANPDIPIKNKYRWKIAILTFISSIGHYICVQLPSALVTYFHSDEFQFTQSQSATFFSITFIPGIAMAIVAGVVADRYGVARTRFYFFVCMTISQLLTAIGCWFKNYPFMLFARLLYGSSCEGFQVASGLILRLKFARTTQ